MADFLKSIYNDHPDTGRLTGIPGSDTVRGYHLRGLTGSSAAMLASAVTGNTMCNHIFLLNDKEEAAYFFNDLETISSDQKIFFFPSPYKRVVKNKETDPAGIIQRTELLDFLAGDNGRAVIVTYPEALLEKVIMLSGVKKMKLKLNSGESVSRDFLIEVLNEYGFRETDFVYEPGEFAIRGSIVDVFSYSGDQPFRIDFFGNEVESIRLFDIESQLSEQKVESMSIIPDLHDPEGCSRGIAGNCKRAPFHDLFDHGTVVWINDLELTLARLDELSDNCLPEVINDDLQETDTLICSSNEFLAGLGQFNLIEFGQSSYLENSQTINFSTSPQPPFSKNFNLLAETLAENAGKGYTNYIFSENGKQFDRLKEIFGEIHGSVPFVPVLAGISGGFKDHDLRICCYTDHQIFDRYHRFRIKESFKRKDSVSLRSIHELQPGDYVVHIDHGIGKFGGLEKIEVNGRIQETLRLVFKDGDILFVSIHSLHRISKYKGKEGEPPKIYKLGSGAWQKLKEKTKNKVKDIARELISLYARRKMEEGFSFSADSYLQRELEASFIYEDTPDQLKATGMVKEQMEADVPMDMLVCGDVGFGKTEVAIRAAFKAVADSKQVAVLVPTTILAMQHHTTFSQRLKDLPCKVEHLSRLRPAKKQKEIIGRLAEGRIDILIGTHRIIGRDVIFKDMGLLIIDEEQKFGVTVKEKLKKLKLNVDTLTLTATPIPRTLQFSLMGARDLAIINTPPPNRHPIITELSQFDTGVIREAVEYEIQRGGQVFFIHNRIQNIGEMEAVIRKECPGVKTITAHGQMESSRLEKIMLGFIAGEYDVLVSTTIIESGLDIPNANTIIINNAHHFGLSDLHQLRGRVGRSNKKAFCYLLAPPPQGMTKEARQRLKAIEDFSELGSGFSIAMQDLDIRGAGNLLGREQSGFITDIGFETYHKILDEALRELRETEFSHIFSDNNETMDSGNRYINDCQVDTDMELLFPVEYIPGNTERIRLYRILDNTTDEESLLKFEQNLTDRFGPLPEQTRDLMNVVRLRRLAVSLGFEKILLKNGIMIIYMISNQMSHYYRSPLFSGILGYIRNQRKIGIREEKNKLTLRIENIHSVAAALGEMEKLYAGIELKEV